MAYTLANLQTDIRSYTEVDNDPNKTPKVLTDSVLDTIIKNSENKIYRSADNDDNRFYSTSTLASGNRYVTIPDDLRIIRYAQLTNAAGEQTFLERKDTSFMAEYYNTPNTAFGIPKYYGNWDSNFWVVSPTPNAQFSVTLAFVKQPKSITDTLVVNNSSPALNGTYLSNKYQDLLLYTTLVNTYGYLKGPAEMLQMYTQSAADALQTYAIEQQGRRRRDEYQDGVIRTPLKSPFPSDY